MGRGSLQANQEKLTKHSFFGGHSVAAEEDSQMSHIDTITSRMISVKKNQEHYKQSSPTKFHHPPKPLVSLARDFIHNSLYNPNYGYFLNQVEIFDRTSIPTNNNTSGSLEDELYAEYFNPKSGTPQNQLLICCHHHHLGMLGVWPITSYKNISAKNLSHKRKSERSTKWERGKKTLCVGILDYIRSHHPSIYATMEYVTITVSSR
ncbi:hypothetical protein PSTT_05088 [Puccinia striiformis]|uniref:Uncharacterized protein n=1 Tax=Puccinia striiformis TaxID=27350 RepID=A0A2S4VQF0_9BASI|nr:hypothetical protein PSTT_05088 [Puccinia striiformis]